MTCPPHKYWSVQREDLAARTRTLWFVPLAIFFATLTSHAQQIAGLKGTHFSVSPEFYPAPHQAQMKSLLQGDEAQPQPDGSIVVKGAKLQTFREDGQRELLVETPQCVYRQANRSVSSPESLRVEGADGKFSIQGQGFLWQQTNSSLFISNQVHSTVHPALLGPGSPNTGALASEAGGIDVFSDRFNFSEHSGIGVYDGNVRATGTNLLFTGGTLTINFPAGERRIESITAEHDVVVDYQGVRATGQKAVFNVDTDVVSVTGEPTWKAERLEGRGDELVIERTNRVVRVLGHARLKAPGRGPGGSRALTAAPRASSAVATNQFIEVSSDNYEIRTNMATFRGGVRTEDREASQLLGSMTCKTMIASFSGTNELQNIIAENNVLIEQQDQRLTADRAVYTAADEVMELTGHPAWQAGPREGKGERIFVDTAQSEMTVRGGASVRLPANDLAHTSPSLPASPQKSSAAITNFAEITCEEYRLKPEKGHFQGGVLIKHPDFNLVCSSLDADFPSDTGQQRSISADRDVVFDMRDEKGQTVHGSSDKVLWNSDAGAAVTNSLIKLMGNATLVTTNGTFRNNVICVDLANNRLFAAGNYRIEAAPGSAVKAPVVFPRK